MCSVQQSGTCLDALVQCAGVHVRRGQAGQREGLSVHSKGAWHVCCVLYKLANTRGAPPNMPFWSGAAPG